jgi:hypothetical protein
VHGPKLAYDHGPVDPTSTAPSGPKRLRRPSWPTPASVAVTRSQRGYRGHALRGGAAAVGVSAAALGPGLHGEYHGGTGGPPDKERDVEAHPKRVTPVKRKKYGSVAGVVNGEGPTVDDNDPRVLLKLHTSEGAGVCCGSNREEEGRTAVLTDDGGGAWTKFDTGRRNLVAGDGQEAREGWRDVAETLKREEWARENQSGSGNRRPLKGAAAGQKGRGLTPRGATRLEAICTISCH